MRRKTGKILGISIDFASKKTILEEVRKGLIKRDSRLATRDWKTGKPVVIVTPNPEQIVLANENPWFADLLNQADVALPDGVGVAFFARHLNDQSPNPNDQHGITRIPGVEFMEDLVEMASKERVRIGLIGGTGKVAVEAFECLQARWKGLSGVAVEVPELEVRDQNVERKQSNTEYRIANTGERASNTESRRLNTGERDKGLPELKLKNMSLRLFQQSEGKAWGIDQKQLNSVKVLDSQFSIHYSAFDEYIKKLAELIVAARIQMVFVALGAPKQELFVHRLSLELQKLSASKTRIQQLKHRNVNAAAIQYSAFSIQHSVLMSVGGAFDMIAGKTRRAPQFMRTMGFEWLYRLILEPWRWRRQLALFKFLLLCIKYH